LFLGGITQFLNKAILIGGFTNSGDPLSLRGMARSSSSNICHTIPSTEDHGSQTCQIEGQLPRRHPLQRRSW
jgi:hypothetical protein